MSALRPWALLVHEDRGGDGPGKRRSRCSPESLRPASVLGFCQEPKAFNRGEKGADHAVEIDQVDLRIEPERGRIRQREGSEDPLGVELQYVGGDIDVRRRRRRIRRRRRLTRPPPPAHDPAQQSPEGSDTSSSFGTPLEPYCKDLTFRPQASFSRLPLQHGPCHGGARNPKNRVKPAQNKHFPLSRPGSGGVVVYGMEYPIYISAGPHPPTSATVRRRADGGRSVFQPTPSGNLPAPSPRGSPWIGEGGEGSVF